MNVSDLILKFREDLKIDESMMSDDDITRFINKSAKKISEYFPSRSLSYVTTVKDQTRYSVNVSGLLRIVEVYYDGVDTRLPVTNFFNTGFSRQFDSGNMSTFALSSNMEFVQRLETLKKMLPVCAQIIDYNTFDLIPTPGADGINVYYEYETYKAITQIPEIFEDEVVALVMYYANEGEYLKKVSNPSRNTYNFDRRGNNTTGGNASSEFSVEMKNRKDTYNGIVKEIKRKVIKMT